MILFETTFLLKYQPKSMFEWKQNEKKINMLIQIIE